MARSQRRRLVGEAVEWERGKEAALVEQLEEVVAELEGPRIDEQVLAGMTPDDAAIVRAALAGPGAEDEEDPDADELASAADVEAQRRELLDEVARLEEEIALSRRRCLALERYRTGLDGRVPG